MSYTMYHVVRIHRGAGSKPEYIEHLESSSKKEVETKLAELVPTYGVSCVKVFTEVEYSYAGMAQLKGGDSSA